MSTQPLNALCTPISPRSHRRNNERYATEPTTAGAHIRLQVGQVVLSEAACRDLLQQGLPCLLELLLLFHAPHPAKTKTSRGKARAAASNTLSPYPRRDEARRNRKRCVSNHSCQDSPYLASCNVRTYSRPTSSVAGRTRQMRRTPQTWQIWSIVDAICLVRLPCKDEGFTRTAFFATSFEQPAPAQALRVGVVSAFGARWGTMNFPYFSADFLLASASIR